MVRPTLGFTEDGLKYRAMRSKVSVRIIASLVLAFLSVGVISLVDKLPYSHWRDVISDSLRLPAYLIAGVLAPGGVHGRHPALWAYSGIIALYCTYGVFWFLILALFRHRQQGE